MPVPTRAAFVLALPFGGTGPRPVHVNLTAWLVNTSPGGTVTFKLKRLADPARLQHVLAEAGVPAIVRWSQNCREQHRIVGAPAAKIVSEKYVGGPHGRFERPDGRLLPAYAYTITPAAMPRGARFVISAGATASQRGRPAPACERPPPIRGPGDRLGTRPGRDAGDLRPVGGRRAR